MKGRPRTFNTINPDNPKHLLPNERYIIINEDLEYAFSESDLNYIQDFAHERWIGDIAKDLKRNEWEVLWAYVYLLRNGADLPPLGVRK